MKGNQKTIIGSMAFATLMGASAAWAGTPVPTFTYLGDIPGGIPSSFAYQVTSNGVVLGRGNSAFGERAARWTSATGMVSLSSGNNPSDTYAADMTPDGSVFVGSGTYRFEVLDEFGQPIPVSVQHAFRWTQATGMVDLGTLNPTQPSYAQWVSNDGLTIYGSYTPVGQTTSIDGIWTQATGWQPHARALTGPYPADDTNANGTYWVRAWSDDFTVAVGDWYDPDVVVGYSIPRAFRWTAATGVQLLDPQAQSPRKSEAMGMTPDGQFIIGSLYDDEGFRWSAVGGVQPLGVLRGKSVPNSISDDGSIITVEGYGESGDEWIPEPQIWTVSGGLQTYEQFLRDAGLPVDDIITPYSRSGYEDFLYVGGVSPDGRYLLGSTAFIEYDEEWNYNNAFIIDLGEGVVCTADFNGVNGVSVQDIFDFLTAWLAGNSAADFNNINGVTVQDIFDFLTAWLAGC